MKSYICTHNKLKGISILGVFSSYERADSYIEYFMEDKNKFRGYNSFSICSTETDVGGTMLLNTKKLKETKNA